MALPAHREHELRHLASLSEAVALVVPQEHRGFDHEQLGRDLRADVDSLRHLIVHGDDVVDGIPIDGSVTLHQRLQGHGAEIVGADGGERAAEAADRRADVIADESFSHR